MAGPALLGLGALGQALIGAFIGVVSWLGTYVTKRVALTLAVIVLLISTTTGFILAVEALIDGIQLTIPYGQFVGHFVPAEFSTLLGIYVSARLLWWGYQMNWLIIRMRLL